MVSNPLLAPAADRVTLLVHAFCEMSEAEFTENVLSQLFRNLGYERVDYHGGPDERGKDLICWGTDEVGDVRLTTVQVKKYRLTTNAAKTTAFTGIINQLTQAIGEKVVNTDGIAYLPTTAYFITPYPISTRALQSCFESYQNLRNVRVLDGIKVASLVCEKNPSLASAILGVERELKWVSNKHLTNEVLLSALGYNRPKSLKEIYTDIDFGIGCGLNTFFFQADFDEGAELKSREFEIGFPDWESLRKANSAAKSHFDTNLLAKQEAQLHDRFEADWKSYAEYLEQTSAIARAQQEIATMANRLSRKLREATVDSSLKGRELKDVRKNCEVLTSIIEGINELPCTARELDKAAARYRSDILARGDCLASTKGSRIDSVMIEEIVGLLDRAVDCHRARSSIRAKVEEPKRKVTVNGSQLASLLAYQREEIKRTIVSFRDGLPTPLKLRTFIESTRKLLSDTDSVLFDEHVRKSVGISEDQRLAIDRQDYRLPCPISLLFDSGADVLVLGEAGAGKSTSLQMYAATLLENDGRTGTIYVPLSSMLNAWAEREPNSESDARDLLDGFTHFFVRMGAKVAREDFSEVLCRDGSVLLLDGIDEVIKNFPWIIESCLSLKSRFPGLQIILSSRHLGSHTTMIPFFPISLLPFTEDQRKHFFDGWFGAATAPEVIDLVEHLRTHKELSDASCNPLLATILCTLQERKIRLPDTEVMLYEERMRLLLGDYDKEKGIARTKTRRRALEYLSRRLAYDLHIEGKREANLKWFYERASSHLGKKGEYVDPHRAVDELIDPSNVLMPMNDQGHFGFGHLRFQEYLAARELYQNRFLPYTPLLQDPGWKGALELFAQMTDNPDEVLSVAANLVNSSDEVLQAMINARSAEERPYLTEKYRIQ